MKIYYLKNMSDYQRKAAIRKLINRFNNINAQ